MYASIVVPTYNRKTILETTLKALLNQTIPSNAFEIIIVDDCSSDETEDFMQEMSASISNLTYIRHMENQRWTITRNDGIKTARGDIVIFLDDDNVPEKNFVEEHIRYHEENGCEHIAVMGNVSFASEVIRGSNFGRYLQSRYLGNRNIRDRANLDYLDLPARCLGTLNCSVRRTDLLAVGMFDVTFKYYSGEDEYLGHCLKRLGIRLLFGERARSVHWDNVSIQRYKLKMTEAARGSIRIILSKSPEYYEDTQVRFLLPIDWGKDKPKRIVVKCFLKTVLNGLVSFLLEYWAFRTNRYSWLYCKPIYRLLVTSWILQGLRSKQGNVRLFTYGNEKKT